MPGWPDEGVGIYPSPSVAARLQAKNSIASIPSVTLHTPNHDPSKRFLKQGIGQLGNNPPDFPADGVCTPQTPRAVTIFRMWFEHSSLWAVNQLVCVPGPLLNLSSVRYEKLKLCKNVGYTHAGDASPPWAASRPG